MIVSLPLPQRILDLLSVEDTVPLEITVSTPIPSRKGIVVRTIQGSFSSSGNRKPDGGTYLLAEGELEIHDVALGPSENCTPENHEEDCVR